MGGRRKKNKATTSSPKKKKKGGGRPGRDASTRSSRHDEVGASDLDAVLRRADAAFDASDADTALALYVRASNALRRRIDGSGEPSSQSTNGPPAAAAQRIEDDDVETLVRILGKTGEIRVSMGDREGGRSDFLEAISLVGDADDDGIDAAAVSPPPLADDGSMGGSGSSLLLDAARRREARAGLHLYLGQLSAGDEALSAYRNGVRELERVVKLLERLCGESAGGGGGAVARMKTGDDDGEGDAEMAERGEEEKADTPQTMLAETRRQLCGAHCSVAELYLTDLCYEPDAERCCESALQSALILDESTGRTGPPDAPQTAANLRLSQGRGLDAVPHALETYDRMKAGCEALSSLVGLGHRGKNDDGGEGTEEEQGAQELTDVDAASSLPGFEFRCQSAKLLLECASVLAAGQQQEEEEGKAGEGGGAGNAAREGSDTLREQQAACVEASIQVLGSLLAENDEVVEVWYLVGCAFASYAPPNVDAARYYWGRAMEMLMKVKEGMEQASSSTFGGSAKDDEEWKSQLEEVGGQIKEVEGKLAGLEQNEGKVPLDVSEEAARMDVS